MTRRLTVNEARRRWAKRRRQYVVGYVVSGNCIFWDARGRKRGTGVYGASDPMTLTEARALLDDMPSHAAAIFRLTPIAVGGGRQK